MTVQPPTRLEVIAMSEVILLFEIISFLLMLLIAFKALR